MIPVALHVYIGPRTQVALRPDDTVAFNFVVPGQPPTLDESLKPRVSCVLCGIPAPAYMHLVTNAVNEDYACCSVLHCRGRTGKGSPDGDHVWELRGPQTFRVIRIPDNKPPSPA